MDCVKKGIVGYVLQKMDKGQVFLRRRLVPLHSTLHRIYTHLHTIDATKSIY